LSNMATTGAFLDEVIVPKLDEQLAHRAFTMAHASQQDALLQSYRLQLWAFEISAVLLICPSFFLAQAAGLLTAVGAVVWSCAVMWTHRRVGNRFREAISYRQKDVDWAQQQLIVAEALVMPHMRTFTRFKLYQSRGLSMAARESLEAVFFSESSIATEDDVQAYFFSHKSLSRSKAAEILDAAALGVRVIGVAAIIFAGATLL
jgi:hypothetical protein